VTCCTVAKLRPEFRQAWASYFARFIKAYAGAGVPVWGITVQNEPMAKQRWESCIFLRGGKSVTS